MVIHQYASSYFVSRRHIFVILQKFSLLFRRNQLVRFTCSVQVITLGNIDGSVAERFRQWTVPLHAHRVFVMHTVVGSIHRSGTFCLGFPLVSSFVQVFLKCFLF